MNRQNLILDAAKASKTIPDMLFGFNTEVTRRGVWQGLGAEMVSNRKFAATEGAFPKHWNALGETGCAALDATAPFAGIPSLKITRQGEHTRNGISQTDSPIAFQAGEEYVLRLCLQTDDGAKVSATIADTASGEVILQAAWKVIPDEWQTFSTRFAAPLTAQDGCRLEIWTDAGGSFRIGAVSVQRADAFHGMRRDVVERLKEAHPATLRYPGGCYAEFFKWKESLLPADRRPPVGPTGLSFLLPENDDFDACDIGLDDFLALCREVGAEPAITVRMSEETPENAAELVEYCNGAAKTPWGRRRAAGGHPEPYQVKYWFLGNELWSFGRGGLTDARNAAVATARFAKAMKEVDASIRLTGCSFYDNLPWNTALQEEADTLLDDYSMHDYLTDHFKGDLAGIVKAAQTELRPLLERVRECLAKGVHEGKTLEIALDEWNLRWGSRGTIAMGLYTACVLNLLCRDFDALRISRAFYFMAVNEGIIRVSPFDARLDTAGDAFRLMRPHGGSQLVPVAGTFSEELDATASMAQDRRQMTLTLINKNLEAAAEVDIALASFTPAAMASVTCWIPEVTDPEADRCHLEQLQVPVAPEGTAHLSLPPGCVASFVVPGNE